MTEDHYLCWGPDKEDLTIQVDAAIKSKGEYTLDVRAPETVADRSDTDAIIVYCSKGDQNVFYVAKSRRR